MNRLIMLIFTLVLISCAAPTVKIAPSDKPIVINLNIKIDHNIKIKMDKEVEKLVANNEDGIF
jgi:hypothetical protein